MADHVYRVIDLVGSSETSIEDAITSAISKASNTIRHMRWFEVVETRGHIENNKVAHYQVTLKVGFSLEDENVHLQP
ncbi:dodecin family protein [Acetobacteraceae bacterium KSS8]|uniref:Dodecin family protein n=1 Tax=Endosaccharibacter trunci TaxID=2812733 RepID=A0ABT1W455_9PROT|nr:dodecin family protein [Acetobacteraceae bacterium KSS8]